MESTINSTGSLRIYCVYFHLIPKTKKVFYVGVGKKTRPYNIYDRNNLWKKIVNKYGFDVEIVTSDISWDEACRLEIEYIKAFGRIDNKTGCLANLTNGGEGTIGKINSPASIKKWKKSRDGYRHSPETIAKIRATKIGDKNPNFNKKASDITKRRRIITMKNNPLSKEARYKMGSGSRGKRKSQETRNKMSKEAKKRNFHKHFLPTN